MAFMAILQKNRAPYVPRFDFGWPFYDKKSYFSIADFQLFRIFAKIDDLQNFLRAFGFWPFTSKRRPLLKKNIENIFR